MIYYDPLLVRYQRLTIASSRHLCLHFAPVGLQINCRQVLRSLAEPASPKGPILSMILSFETFLIHYPTPSGLIWQDFGRVRRDT